MEEVEEGEEEEVEEDDEGQHEFDIGKPTLPAYVGIIVKELVHGQSDRLRRIGFFHCCEISDMGHTGDGCRDLLKEFEMRRVPLV